MLITTALRLICSLETPFKRVVDQNAMCRAMVISTPPYLTQIKQHRLSENVDVQLRIHKAHMHDVHLPADKTIVEGQDSLVNLCGRKRVVAVQLGSVSFLGQEGGHVESAKSRIMSNLTSGGVIPWNHEGWRHFGWEGWVLG